MQPGTHIHILKRQAFYESTSNDLNRNTSVKMKAKLQTQYISSLYFHIKNENIVFIVIISQ